MAMLNGYHVVITRPRHQAAALQQHLQEVGAVVDLFPVIDIMPVASPLLVQRLSHLQAHDWLIFISQNAVHYAFEQVPHGDAGWRTVQLACIGKKTAQALQGYGLTPALVPQHGFTSEDLLQHAQLQCLANQQVLLLKGCGGREVLAQVLQQRGAQIINCEVYRRVKPRPPLPTVHWDHVDVVCITSFESLQNFMQLVSVNDVTRIPLLVGSRRIASEAIAYGFQQVYTATDPSDEAMVQALYEMKQEQQ